LARYEYTDSQGKNQGINVQAKAKTIVKLLQDDATLASARDSAASNRKVMLARTNDATDARSATFQNLRRQPTPSSEPLSPPNKVEHYDDWGEMSPAQVITPKNCQPEKEPIKMPSLNLIGMDEPEIIKKHDEFEDFDEFQSAEPSPKPQIFTTNTSPAQKSKDPAARPNNGQNDLESFLSMHSELVDLNGQ
jgi:hypothetical protein